MALDPKNEDITELLPHVAAVAAAYGDPKGKYAAFLTKTMADYKTRPFWFYNQTPGLSSSPAAAAHKRRTMWAREDTAGQLQQSETQPVDFICPEVFRKESEVELDNGIFVTCDELRQFYDVVAV